MINSFYLDGVDCRRYGIYPTQKNTYDGAKQNVVLHRPFARSSMIRHCLNTYEPVEIGYTFFSRPELRSKSQSIKDWLNNWDGEWRRLSDSYDPYHYRKVFDVSDIYFEDKNGYGQSEIIFTCEAFRYLKSAEPPIGFNAGTNILVNPTVHRAYPKVTILGDSSSRGKILRVNGVELETATEYTNVTVDFEDLSIVNSNGVNMSDLTSVIGDIDNLFFPAGEFLVYSNFSTLIERRWREI